MQNKANLLDAQMNVSSVLTKYYENKPLCRREENKPNQTQSPFLPPLIKPLLYRLDPLLQVFNFLMLDEVIDNVFGRQTLEAFIAVVQQAGQSYYCQHSSGGLSVHSSQCDSRITTSSKSTVPSLLRSLFGG